MNRLRRIVDNLRFAATSLWGHKLRSALTVLGIVVGVATVIGMVSMVEGFHNNVRENFESFGATLVQFQKFDPNFGPGGFRNADERQRENLSEQASAFVRSIGLPGREVELRASLRDVVGNEPGNRCDIPVPGPCRFV